MPFFGTADDRLVVRFVLQLACNPRVSVLIAHFTPSDDEAEDEIDWSQEQNEGSSRAAGPAKGASAQHIPLRDRAATFLVTMLATLSPDARMRVETEDVVSMDVTGSAIIARAHTYFKTTPPEKIAASQGEEEIVVAGRNAFAGIGHSVTRTIVTPCLGTLGTALLAEDDFKASLLVMQAATVQ